MRTSPDTLFDPSKQVVVAQNGKLPRLDASNLYNIPGDDEGGGGLVPVEFSSLDISTGRAVFQTVNPVIGVKTNLGNYYPIEAGDLTIGQSSVSLDVTRYLSYDNQATFTGTWVAYVMEAAESLLTPPEAVTAVNVGTVSSGSSGAVSFTRSGTQVSMNITFPEGGGSTITVDSTISSGGTNPVTGDAIYSGLSSKMNDVSGGSAGQVLTIVSGGGRVWQDVPQPSMSAYYTSSQVDGLLSSKLNSSALNSYYNSTTVDNKLSSKANSSDLSAVSSLANSKIGSSYLTENNYITSGGVSSMVSSSLSSYYNSSAVSGLLSSKLDAPAVMGSAGWMLGLDDNLRPIWIGQGDGYTLTARIYSTWYDQDGAGEGSPVEIVFTPTGDTVQVSTGEGQGTVTCPVYSGTITGMWNDEDPAWLLPVWDENTQTNAWVVSPQDPTGSHDINNSMWYISGLTQPTGTTEMTLGGYGYETYLGPATLVRNGDSSSSVDLSAYYTSAQVNTLLSSKANTSDLQAVSALANSKIGSSYLTANNYITSGGVSSMVTSSLSSYYNSATVSGMLNSKLNTPATSGTSGQVLALNGNLQPVWVDATPSGGSSSSSSSSSSPSSGGYTLTAPLYDRPADEDESTQIGTITIDFAPIDETDQVAAGGPNENDEYTYVERPVYSGTYNNTTLYLHCVWDNDAFDNAWIITESKDTTDIASAWWTLSGYSPLQETNTFDIGYYGNDMYVGSATLTSNGSAGSSSGSATDLTGYYTSAQVDTLLSSKIATSAIGVSNGVAGLNASGVIPDSQIPKAAVNVFGGVMLQSAGGLKIPTSGTSSGHLMIDPATSNQITSRSGSFRPITPPLLNSAVLGALTDTRHITMDTTQQATARGIIGAADSSTVSSMNTRLTALENGGGGGGGIEFTVSNDTSVTPNTHTVTISSGGTTSSFTVSDGQNGSNGTGGGGTAGGPASVSVTSGATLTLSPNSPSVIDWAPYVSSAGAGNSGPGFAFTFQRYDMSNFEETYEQGPEIESGVINFTATGQTSHVPTGPTDEDPEYVDKPIYSGTFNGQTFYMVYIWDESQYSNQWIIGTSASPESYYDGYWAMSSDPADGMQVSCTETAYYEGYGDGVLEATSSGISYDGTLVLGNGWESGKEYYYKVNFVASSGAVLTLSSGLTFNNNQGTADAVETGMTNEMLVSIRNAGGIVTVLNARRES